MTTKYVKKNYGFIEPKITPDNFIFGSQDTTKTLGGKVVRPDGQWDKFLPKTEYQRKAIETMNCSNFGTLNALETLEKAVYGIEPNHCERYLGVVSGTSKRGNSPHRVAEAIRKKGCIPEDNLPFDHRIKSWNDYYSPNPMTEQYLSVGRQWLRDYSFGHEWVFTNINSEKKTRLMKALKYSPIGISVRAWKRRNGYYWKNPNERDNHWVVCYGYVEGQYWKIYDSYDNTRKRLEWDYNFCYAKKYQLKKKENIIMITKEKLKKIYHEILCREPDALAEGYLAFDEEFVRKEIGKSKERQQLIRIVNLARSLYLIKGR